MAPKSKVKEQAKPVVSFYPSSMLTMSRAAMLLPLWDDDQISQENWGIILGTAGAGGGGGAGVIHGTGGAGAAGLMALAAAASSSSKSGEGKQGRSKDGGGGIGPGGASGGNSSENCFVDMESRNALDKFIRTFYEENAKKDESKKKMKTEEGGKKEGTDLIPAAGGNTSHEVNIAPIPPPLPPSPAENIADKGSSASRTKKSKTATTTFAAAGDVTSKVGAELPEAGPGAVEGTVTGTAGISGVPPPTVVWRRPVDISKPFRPIIHRNSTPFLYPYAPTEALCPIDAKEEAAKASLEQQQQQQLQQQPQQPPSRGEGSAPSKKGAASSAGGSGADVKGSGSGIATSTSSAGAGGTGSNGEPSNALFDIYPETVSIIEDFIGADAAASWKGMTSDIAIQRYREMSPLMEPYDPTLLFGCAETPAEACGSRYSTALRHKLQQAETLEALACLPPFLMSAFNSVLLVLERAQQLLPPGDYLWERIYPHAPGTCHPVYNPYGKYAVKLFVEGAFRKVIVDDALPVDELGRPLITITSTRELWPALLVKAVFKAFGTDAGRMLTDDPELLLPCFFGNYIPEYINPREEILGTTAQLLRYQMQLENMASGKLNPKNVQASTCRWNVGGGGPNKGASTASGAAGGAAHQAHGNTGVGGGTSSSAGGGGRKGKGGAGKKGSSASKKETASAHPGLEKLTAEEIEPPNDEEPLDKRPYLLCGLRTSRNRVNPKPKQITTRIHPQDTLSTSQLPEREEEEKAVSGAMGEPLETNQGSPNCDTHYGSEVRSPPPPSRFSSGSTTGRSSPPPGYGSGVQLFAIVDVVPFRHTLAVRVETTPRSDIQAGFFVREQDSLDVRAVLQRDDPVMAAAFSSAVSGGVSSTSSTPPTAASDGGKSRLWESRGDGGVETAAPSCERPICPPHHRNWNITSVWLTLEEVAEQLDSLVAWRCFDLRYLHQVSIEYDSNHTALPVAGGGAGSGGGHGGSNSAASGGGGGAGSIPSSGGLDTTLTTAPKKYTVQWCSLYSDRPEEVSIVAYAALPPPFITEGGAPIAPDTTTRAPKKTAAKKPPAKKGGGAAAASATAAAAAAPTLPTSTTTGASTAVTKDGVATLSTPEEMNINSVASTGCPTPWVHYDTLRKEPKLIQLDYYQHHLPEPLTQSVSGVYEYGKLRIAALFSLKPGAHIFRITIPEMEFGDRITLTSDAKMTLCGDLNEALKTTMVYALSDAGHFPAVEMPEREGIWFKRMIRVNVPTRLTIVLNTLLPTENPAAHRQTYLSTGPALNVRGGAGGGSGKAGGASSATNSLSTPQGEGGGGAGSGSNSGRGKGGGGGGGVGTPGGVIGGGGGLAGSAGYPGLGVPATPTGSSAANTGRAETLDVLLRRVEMIPIMRFATLLLVNLDTREPIHVSKSGGGGGHLCDILLEPNRFGYLLMAYACVPSSDVAAIRAANEATAALVGASATTPHFVPQSSASTGTHTTVPAADRRKFSLQPRTEDDTSAFPGNVGSTETINETVGSGGRAGSGGSLSTGSTALPLYSRGVWKLTIRSDQELAGFDTLSHNAHVFTESHTLERGGSSVFFRQLCVVTEPVHISLLAEIAEHLHLPVVFRVLHLLSGPPGGTILSSGACSLIHQLSNANHGSGAGTGTLPPGGGGGSALVLVAGARASISAPGGTAGNGVVASTTHISPTPGTLGGMDENVKKIPDSHYIESLIASLSGEVPGGTASVSSTLATGGVTGGLWGVEVCKSDPQERHVFIPDLWLDATDRPKHSFYLIEGSIPADGAIAWDKWCRRVQEERFLHIRAAAEQAAVERQQIEMALLKRDPALFMQQKIEEQQLLQQQQNEPDFRNGRDGVGMWGGSGSVGAGGMSTSGIGGAGMSGMAGALGSATMSGGGPSGGGGSTGGSLAPLGGNRKGRPGDRRKGGGIGGAGGGGVLPGMGNMGNSLGMSWTVKDTTFPHGSARLSGNMSAMALGSDRTSFVAQDGGTFYPGLHAFQATANRLLTLDTVDREMLVPYHVQLILSSSKTEIRHALPPEDSLVVLRQHWKERSLRQHTAAGDGSGSPAVVGTASAFPFSSAVGVGSLEPGANSGSTSGRSGAPSAAGASSKVQGVGKTSRLQQQQREQAAAEEQMRGEQARQSRFRFMENPLHIFIPYLQTPGEDGVIGGGGLGGGVAGASNAQGGVGGGASGGGGNRGHPSGNKGVGSTPAISIVPEDTEERNFCCAPPIPPEEQKTVLLPIRAYEEVPPSTIDNTSATLTPTHISASPGMSGGREGRRGRPSPGTSAGKLGLNSSTSTSNMGTTSAGPSAMGAVGNTSFPNSGNNSSTSTMSNAAMGGSTMFQLSSGGSSGGFGMGNAQSIWEEEDTLQARGPLIEISERLTDMCREKRDEQRKSRKELKRRLYQYYAAHPSLLNSEEGGGGGASNVYPSLIGNRDDDSVTLKRNKAPI